MSHVYYYVRVVVIFCTNMDCNISLIYLEISLGSTKFFPMKMMNYIHKLKKLLMNQLST